MSIVTRSDVQRAVEAIGGVVVSYSRRTDLLAPLGFLWAANGSHAIIVAWGEVVSRAEAQADALESIAMGTEPCEPSRYNLCNVCNNLDR